MHSLIVGVTRSGKTTLATILAREMLARGKKVVVFDPIGGPDWGKGAQVFDNAEDFTHAVRSPECTSAHVFVDESGEILGEGYSREHTWLATRSRHWGHSVYFIGQRAMQIPLTMRTQCTRIYMFTTNINDASIYAEDFNCPALRTCNNMAVYHFRVADRFGLYRSLKLVKDKKGRISVVEEKSKKEAENGLDTVC